MYFFICKVYTCYELQLHRYFSRNHIRLYIYLTFYTIMQLRERLQESADYTIFTGLISLSHRDFLTSHPFTGTMVLE